MNVNNDQYFHPPRQKYSCEHHENCHHPTLSVSLSLLLLFLSVSCNVSGWGSWGLPWRPSPDTQPACSEQHPEKEQPTPVAMATHLLWGPRPPRDAGPSLPAPSLVGPSVSPAVLRLSDPNTPSHYLISCLSLILNVCVCFVFYLGVR